MTTSPIKKQNPQQAKEKIQHYCAYQERSHQEVRNRLFGYGLYSNEVEEIISNLINDGYLNEERFARAFVGGKFRMKNWGRVKITHVLEAKGVSKKCIQIGLEEIDETLYIETLRELLKTKSEIFNNDNIYVTRDKLSKYVIQKGFEPDLVWRAIGDLFPDKKVDH